MSRAYTFWLLASLYLAQGLPYGFFTQALPVLMREQGLSLKAISATSLLFLPWLLKFLWAPYFDRLPRWRPALLLLQGATVVLALLCATVDLGQGWWLMFAALLLFNFAAATQDILTDSLAVNTLGHADRGLGNGIQVGAYRIGMILGGGLLLWVFARSGWSPMFTAMAGLLLLTTLPVFSLRAQRVIVTGTRSHHPLRNIWPRLRQRGMWSFLLLVCTYKFGDSMAASLVGPFLLDSGLTKTDIALIKGTVGSVAALLGAACGGWLAYRYGRRLSLLSCGLLQSLSLVLYLLFALAVGGTPMLWAASIAEHLFGGMATVALFTLMMDASDLEHAATDYTLLSCAAIVSMGLASFVGATLADAFGYPLLFGVGTVLSVVGCLLLVMALDAGHGLQRLRATWQA